ncbi:hypothetical protein [Curtobacterium sp. MCBD17_028]|uniref:hypothetical protein n=1 Tax=Curtobacterium sp. MCBD17_028 TaxID=2175670 RepID=UPI0011B7A141|nr:hypothetical protein [Curtobacterium sp. MCBD17_028]
MSLGAAPGRRTGREARHPSAGPGSAAGVEVMRGGLGVLHLLAARGGAPDRATGARRGGVAAFHRVLGLRQLVEAVVLRRVDTPDAHTVAAVVDATHAVSMLPLLLVGGRWRRLGASQLVIAVGLGVAEALLVGRGRRR